MNILRRRRLWREPPIVFQILVLLLGGLIVAQVATLLLTLVFPPAPPVQHGMADIVATMQGRDDAGGLMRRVQSGPPDIDGEGWFTSAESRHDLATRLGANDADVRLAFYAPLPFAGITAPPSRALVPIGSAGPAAVAARPVDWQVSPDLLRPMAMRLRPASLLLADPGPPPGGSPGGAMGGGFPGGPGFPGGGFGGASGDRAAGARGNDAVRGNGERGDRGIGGSAQRGGAAQRGGSPSPGDLDRQPGAPAGQPAGEGGAAHGEGPGGGFADSLRGSGGRLPTEGFDMRSFGAGQQIASPPQTPPSNPTVPVTPETVPASTQLSRAAVPHRVEAPASAAATATSTPAPVVSRAARPEARPAEVRALPIEPQSHALFGLAPAPFVEGDFVAALRRADGRWIVVQPAGEGFPNAWQRRVMLWFAIAFALVAPIGWLFARHIVRPLARFTAAAEQLGRDPSAALVALEGPAEIGRAAHAFNVMQNRLRSFVDDRTAMVGAISHDLRTPLTRMRFRIEEVEDDTIRDGMSAEVTEMEAMISSVLSFIRDASTPNVRERLDLGMLVEDVAQDAAMIGGEVTVEQVALAPVEVDVLGVRRLLTNLVENAVKYGDRARIRLAVDEDAAIAEIHDDGPGVPEDELERAFEPFYRASNATGSGKSGSGLGLAVCRSIARAHGGDVRLIRSPDGFAAQLRLPLAYDAAPLAA